MRGAFEIPIARLAGNPRPARIISRFVEQLPAKLAQMSAALGGRDMTELAALAHWLKGAGGSMGFDDLFEPARALEEPAKARDHGRAATIVQELNHLERRIQRGMAPSSREPAEATP